MLGLARMKLVNSAIKWKDLESCPVLVHGYQCAIDKFALHLPQSYYHRLANHFWSYVPRPNLNNAWLIPMCRGKDRAKIQVIGKNDIVLCFRKGHNLCIGSVAGSEG